MHKTLRVQLPDLRYLDCRVDFSVKTFNAVVTLCKELGIRHPEELSFGKPLESDDLRYNYRERESNANKKRSVAAAASNADTNTFISHHHHHHNSTHSSNNSLDNIKATSGCTPVLPNTTINRSPAPVPTPISSPVTFKD